MTDTKALRLNKVAKELNVGIETIVEFLKKKKFDIDNNPNTKISPEMYNELLKEFSSDSNLKKKSESINITSQKTRSITIDDVHSTKNEQEENDIEEPFEIKSTIQGIKVVGKIDLDTPPSKKQEEPAIVSKPENKEIVEEKTESITEKKEPELITTEIPKIAGPKIQGKIDLNDKKKKKKKEKEEKEKEKQINNENKQKKENEEVEKNSII
ncbi:MAG: hypothetical protein ACUVQP_10715, partial [Bacteroidales bacterium]